MSSTEDATPRCRKTPRPATLATSMPGTARSPGANNPKGTPKATQDPKGPAPPTTESIIFKEIRELKGEMVGMEHRLGVRVMDLEKKLEDGNAETLAAVATLEKRVKKNEVELGPKIERALDARIQSGALNANIERVVSKKFKDLP